MEMMGMRIQILVNRVSVFTLVLLAGCSNQKIDNEHETVNPSHKELKSNKSYYPDTYDYEIIEIGSLFDSSSVNLDLNKVRSLLTSMDEIVLVNSKEQCKMHIANGGKFGEFSHVRLTKLESNSVDLKHCYNTNVEVFKTNLGNYLGMNFQDFMKINSNKKFIENKKADRFTLTFTDEYEMYKAEYLFINDVLENIDFGYYEP